MSNHGYETPAAGARNWHEPLNANFDKLDRDVEIRDSIENLSEYDPQEGAKFYASDAGWILEGQRIGNEGSDGDGELQWVRVGVIPKGNSFANDVVGEFSVVVGGLDNRASGPQSVVVGGKSNLASGRSALASGKRARATHDGSVVFGDHTSTAISSKSSRELRSQMPVYAPAFCTTSARAAKTDIRPIDPDETLAGVEALTIAEWQLKSDADGEETRHIGPMAEEFQATFELGGADESIATVDADGVAFAAIQGLAARLDSERDRRELLESTVDRREERIDELVTACEQQSERIEALERHLEGLSDAEIERSSGTDSNGGD